MTNPTGWYPPGQVCYPPELPAYLKNIYDLKPVVGAPSEAEVIGIHSVIHAANRVSVVPGMHDPGLLMGLADHLFGAQMAKYRNKYSLIVFPSDATYTPPTATLPAHISVNLETVIGAPSNEEIIKAQEAVRSYQQFSHVPSLFDAHVNMELSQHLFDLQMARYMRCAGEGQQNPGPRPKSPVQTVEQRSTTSEETSITTNNAGTGASTATAVHAAQTALTIDALDVMEQPNVPTGENTRQPMNTLDPLTERFNQIHERFNQIVEQLNRSAQQANQLSERSNQLIERSNLLCEQLVLPIQQSNQLLEGLNQLLEGFNQHLQRS
ncbi:hypothetical protein RSAG8_12464, partial [Rhizoctonia solani AG-8 WAC10335]